jgi:signal transduction histidine kinase
MSHELRTPLNSVIGFAELLIERAERVKPEKIRSYAQRMLGASEHLLDLISDLLEVAKIDAGALNPVFANFNLASCIEDICDMLKPIADKKNLELKFETPPEMPVCADRRLVRQILINLINNALKFTHEGGVTVRASKEKNEYRIDVVDTGIGIAPEDLRRIFKDFHRVETGLTSNYEGVGIGLTLSKRLVELHEGRIIVNSETGKGSSFSVFLPLNNINKNQIKEGNSDEKNA